MIDQADRAKRILAIINWRHFLMVWTSLLVFPLAYWLAPARALVADPLETVAAAALYIYAHGATCVLAFLLAWRLPIGRRTIWYVLPAYIVFAAAVGLGIDAALTQLLSWLNIANGPVNTSWAGPRPFSSVIAANMLIAGNAIRAGVRASTRQQDLAELQRQLAETELAAVSHTLDPEDTFPSLESIRLELGRDPEQAQALVVEFGDRIRRRLAPAE
jgi:hypothetical protein